MHRLYKILTSCTIVVTVLAAGSRGQEPVRAVATLPNLASIAQEIGGELVDVKTLLRDSQDPHYVEIKGSQVAILRDAELFLVNGLDLESGLLPQTQNSGWLSQLTQSAHNPKVVQGGPGFVDLSRGITVLELSSAPATRAEGMLHARGNPHYLMDPVNGVIVAREIAELLTRVRPDAKETFAKRCDEFCARLAERLVGKEVVDQVGAEALQKVALSGNLQQFLETTVVGDKPLGTRIGGWMGAMRPLKGMKVITYRRDLSYFAKRFGLEIVDCIEPQPGITPSAKRVEELLPAIKREQVRLLITRPWGDSSTVDALAKRSEVKVLNLPLEGATDANGKPDRDAYLMLIDRTIRDLVASGGP